VSMILSLIPLRAQDEEEQGGDPNMNPSAMAEKEVERLTDMLKLEDWQIFYIDSTLQYNYVKWFAELNQLQRSAATNMDLYLAVKDKWQVRNEEAYKKFFTEQQWKKYLKEGGESIIKERERRQQKRQEATEGGKQKKKKSK